jgi:hypothetical protein
MKLLLDEDINVKLSMNSFILLTIFNISIRKNNISYVTKAPFFRRVWATCKEKIYLKPKANKYV